jgi:hypothetical protein
VSENHQLPEEPVRSKGEATLLPAGQPELSAAIRTISASGIEVVADRSVSPGTFIELHIHDHAAHGIVETCREENGAFYIAIALAA